LFGTDSQESQEDSVEEEGEKTISGKKVMWDTDVADNQAGKGKLKKTGVFDIKNSVFSTNMHQTKIGFD